MKKIFLVLFVVCSLQGFAQSPDFYYTSPKSDAKFVNPEQVILLKSYNEIVSFDKSQIQLYDRIGEVSINIRIENNKLVFIEPTQKLRRNTEYQLLMENGAIQFMNETSDPFSLRFSTEKEDNIHFLERYYQREKEAELNQGGERGNTSYKYNPPKNDNSYPSDYPIPYVENVNNPLPGYLFLNIGARNAPGYNSYAVILDNNAIPIWFTAENRRDLKILADGTFTHDYRNNANLDLQGYFIRNDQLKVTDTIRMGNGYYVDTHDMLLLENGHYLMMAYDPQVVDMSEIVEGGNPEAIVEGFVVQEVDKDRNVYFEWRSWDYLEITDVSDTIDLTAEEIDYVHGNAFDFDLEGNLMMSLRNMEEITKINYETGEIIWRLGLLSKNNMFTFNDTIGWSWQHDIRQLPNGNITIYDNGRNHRPESFSQAVEYQLDEENMTATLVWNHREDPDIYRRATGSHRRIAEDRSLIGWGMGSPLLATEISTNGERHLDLLGPEGTNDYRVQRFEWIHNVFTFNKDTLDFGEYDDYVPVSRTFKVANQMDEDTITINSSHNHLDDYWLVSQLPIVLAPGEEENVIVNFQPQGTGEFVDVLTLNYDNIDTTERIARQIVLTGSTPTGIHEYENDKVSVNPNPATDWIDIHIEFKGNKTIRIYNVAGQQLLEKKTNDQLMRLSTANLTQGVYTGLVSSNDGQATFRFIVK
ncbi:MAG: aryl-sulfate sulfotransferase [Bacteroidetes bacterium]|nr:aryl-sulfate sulfotransferase [Bacteroidota bacterium]